MSIADRADFSHIRYAQCWEDADILLEALAIQPGDRCLGIASAGDNCLSMLLCDPSEVVAVDLSAAQLACVALRIAAYRHLNHGEFLQLLGSRPCAQRTKLYSRCRQDLDKPYQEFWDRRLTVIQRGIGGAGKFERYFALFRERMMPWVHDRRMVHCLLTGKGLGERRRFYDQFWSTPAWRLMFRFFFSRFVMGRLGRDKAFFNHVDGPVAERILKRTRHALRELDPALNPYLHWILTGTHGKALPLALRAEHFNTIKERVDRITLRQTSLENILEHRGEEPFSRFNLSDVFEYMPGNAHHELMQAIHRASRTGGRVVYWNMLADRQCPAALAHLFRPLQDEGDRLLAHDKAWFYSALRIDEVL